MVILIKYQKVTFVTSQADLNKKVKLILYIQVYKLSLMKVKIYPFLLFE